MGTVSVEVDAPEEPRSAVEVTHAPARASAVGAVVTGLLAAVTSAPASIIALVVAVFGVAGLVVGTFVRPSRRVAGIGTAVIFAGVVASGLSGAGEGLVVFGVLASILSFDLTQNAFVVGDQLSTGTETWRGEAVHAAGTAAVGAISVVLAFAIYLVAGGELATAGLAFLFVAAIVLIWAIRA